jgi:hypothetical protein
VPLPDELRALTRAALAQQPELCHSVPPDPAEPWHATPRAHSLALERTPRGCSEKFAAQLREFLEGQVDAYAAVRAALGLPQRARGAGPGAAVREYVAGCAAGLSRRELAVFVARCIAKHKAKRVDAGAALALVAAAGAVARVHAPAGGDTVSAALW